jgi:hypothetical protein
MRRHPRPAYAARVPESQAVDRLTKRTLVTVSHAIEQAALAAAEDGPMVVIALFQRLPYFEREREVYERIAARATVTVMGLVTDQTTAVPAGAHMVELDEKEDLAREWTVVVLTPRFGAVLVAHDQEEIEPGAATIESGRVFRSRYVHRRDDALHEVLRLRGHLADRLPPSAVSALDAVVDRVRELPATPGESRADAALRLFAEQAERDHARLRAARRQRTDDDGTGLPAAAGVHRWAGSSGVTASGVLPVGVLAVRITHGTDQADQFLGRTAARQQEAAIGLLVGRLGAADRATKVGDGEYLLFLPGRSYDDTVRFAYGLGQDLAAAAGHNAFLTGTTVTVALTVTRRRPLPVEELREAARWAAGEGMPVVTIDG